MTRPSASEHDFGTGLTGPGLDIDPRPLIGPDGLMDRARAEARREDDEQREARALLRRLVIAFVLMFVLMGAFVVLVAELHVRVPPIVFLLSFIAIAAGSLLTVMLPGQAPTKRRDAACCSECDDGRPVGCCSGPRPLRAFRDDRPAG
ncbi:MAG: hypothetical protein R3B57_11555 [Phycisphaerales bacterium]